MKRIAKPTFAKQQKRGGFTLIEILIVIAIILVIAAMAVPSLMGRQKEAMISATKITVKGIEKATKYYFADHDGTFPEGGQEVWESLMEPEDYRGKKFDPYLEEIPKDAWGEPLYYKWSSSGGGKNRSKPDIWSSGPNRVDDGGGDDTDDIGNWPRTDDN